jgi:hypothetical protein
MSSFVFCVRYTVSASSQCKSQDREEDLYGSPRRKESGTWWNPAAFGFWTSGANSARVVQPQPKDRFLDSLLKEGSFEAIQTNGRAGAERELT